MNSITDQKLLTSICHALGIKSIYMYLGFSGIQTKATAFNVKKIERLAEAVKFSGKHLVITLKEYEEGKELHLQLECNTEEVYKLLYTLIGFEHDLASFA